MLRRGTAVLTGFGHCIIRPRSMQAAGETSEPLDGDAPETPEELEFEDDDGTVYVWDNRYGGQT